MSLSAYGAISFVFSVVSLLAVLAALIIVGVRSRGTARLLGVLGFAALALSRIISMIGSFAVSKIHGAGVVPGLLAVNAVTVLISLVGIVLIAIGFVTGRGSSRTGPVLGYPPQPGGYGPGPGQPGPYGAVPGTPEPPR